MVMLFHRRVALRHGLIVAALFLGLATTSLSQSAIFFAESWESGSAAATFNSRSQGNAATASQFSLENGIGTVGSWGLSHNLFAALAPGGVQYVTQHFADAVSTPVHSVGQGEHFQDLYVQYKVYYSPGFDFGTGYKQFIIGTEDNRRHDTPCCNPWVAHYLTVYLREGGIQQAEANNKQAASGQWLNLNPNTGGYNSSNPFRVQAGRWYTVEVRRRLNDSGVDNGIFQMWLDGQLISDYQNVRWRVPYNGTFGAEFLYGTNFAMISDYTVTPVARDQQIRYDDVRMSTSYIGGGSATPPAAPTNVRVVR